MIRALLLRRGWPMPRCGSCIVRAASPGWRGSRCRRPRPPRCSGSSWSSWRCIAPPPRPRRPDGAGATDPIALALDRLVGIGPVLALTLRAEIGDITRFARRPKLASLAGVVARVESSAGQIYYGRITRQGSPWLRWTLIEAARHAMKRPDAVGRWARRLALRKGLAKARVALVRRLCDDIVTQWPRSV